jgi:hypothetical protein
MDEEGKVKMKLLIEEERRVESELIKIIQLTKPLKANHKL